MDPADPVLDAALRRMLDAEEAIDDGPPDHRAAWQRAASDYWVLRHPELARYRRGDPARVPSVAEMQERAEQVVRARDTVPPTWRLLPPSARRSAFVARVGWFHEQLAGLYEPIEHARRRARDDASGVEVLIRFLEADVYCFRSGYVKADVIRSLTRADLSEESVRRLRRVVLNAVDGRDRREFRAYVRLARRVDGPDLRQALLHRLSAESRPVARRARWVVEGLDPAPATR